MNGTDLKQDLDLLHSVITDIQDEEQDTFLTAILTRMKTNIHSINILYQEDCLSDAHAIERVLLEHAGRLYHFKSIPLQDEDMMLFKVKQTPSLSKILDELDENGSAVYSVISSFTHTDFFSLMFELDRSLPSDQRVFPKLTSISLIISRALIHMVFDILLRTYQNTAQRHQKHLQEFSSRLESTINALGEAMPNMPISEEERIEFLGNVGWRVREPLDKLLSSIDDLTEMGDVLVDYIRGNRKQFEH